MARGRLLALERGRVGERYILGGDDLMLRELLGEIAGLTGRRAPRGRLRGTEPFLTVDSLAMSRNRMLFSSDMARRELGYRPGPHMAACGRRSSVRAGMVSGRAAVWMRWRSELGR